MYKGVREENIDKLKEIINGQLNIPADKLSDVDSWWELAPIVDS